MKFVLGYSVQRMFHTGLYTWVRLGYVASVTVGLYDAWILCNDRGCSGACWCHGYHGGSVGHWVRCYYSHCHARFLFLFLHLHIILLWTIVCCTLVTNFCSHTTFKGFSYNYWLSQFIEPNGNVAVNNYNYTNTNFFCAWAHLATCNWANCTFHVRTFILIVMPFNVLKSQHKVQTEFIIIAELFIIIIPYQVDTDE